MYSLIYLTLKEDMLLICEAVKHLSLENIRKNIKREPSRFTFNDLMEPWSGLRIILYKKEIY